jgi:hypothetical protein
MIRRYQNLVYATAFQILKDTALAENVARFLGITEGALRKRLHDGKKILQERTVRMAEKSFQVYRLPPDFARRCMCGCRRSQAVEKRKGRKGVI